MQSAMPSRSTTVRTRCPCHRDMSRNGGEEAVGQREREEGVSELEEESCLPYSKVRCPHLDCGANPSPPATLGPKFHQPSLSCLSRQIYTSLDKHTPSLPPATLRRNHASLRLQLERRQPAGCKGRRHEAGPDRVGREQRPRPDQRMCTSPLDRHSPSPDSPQRVNNNCFEHCFPTPGSSMTSSEETCISNCMEKYISMWNVVNRTYVGRISSESKKMGQDAGTLTQLGTPPSDS
jgi:hypothetical protein